LGELLDVDYETMQLMALYRASDVLWKHHAAIEQRLFRARQRSVRACHDGYAVRLDHYGETPDNGSSQIFAGNVAEAGTLAVMRKGLNAPISIHQHPC
jgi:hypothetical protein